MGYWKYEIVHDYNATKLIKEFQEENLKLKNSKGADDDETDFIIYAEKDDHTISLGRVLLVKMSDAMVKYHHEYKGSVDLPKFWGQYIYEQNKNNNTFQYKEDEIAEAFLESIKLQTKLLSNISALDLQNFIKKVTEEISESFRKDERFSREQWDPTLKSDDYLFAEPEKAINYFIQKCDSLKKTLKKVKDQLEILKSFTILGKEVKIQTLDDIIKGIDEQIKSVEELKKWLIEKRDDIKLTIPFLCGVWNGLVEFVAGFLDIALLAINITVSNLAGGETNLEFLEIREGVEEALGAVFKDPTKVFKDAIEGIKNYKYTRYDDPKLNQYQIQHNEGEDLILAIDITVTIVTIIKGIAKLAKLLSNFTKWIDEVLARGGKGARKVKNALSATLKLSDGAEILLKKYADNAVLGFTKLKRPTVVSVLEGNGKRVFAYSNKAKLAADEIPKGLHPLVKKWLNDADKTIKQIPHHGKCAEPSAISKWLWEVDPKGKMKIDQARKQFERVVSKAVNIESKKVKPIDHATYKEACKSCNPLLDYFNITEVH
jgi:hypothetical protein